MKTLYYGLFILTNSILLPQAQAGTNHQVEVGFSDLAGLDKSFFGARYRYFNEDLSQLSGPHGIKVHLNQVNNIALGGFVNDNLYYINSDASFYGENGLVVKGAVQHVRDERGSWESQGYLVSASLGKQINTELQIGLGVFYSRSEDSSSYNNIDYLDVEWTYAPYIRWTKITNNQGWDLEAKQLLGRERNIQGRAAYYINQNCSVGLVANILSGEHSHNNYELQTQYWFNEQLALKFGLGSSLESGAGLNSASLLFTARF